MMVVFVHLDVQLRRYGLGGYDGAWLATGVDIFFVISGFIMWVTTAKNAGITGAKFMRNRIIRIVPLYWMVSFFVLATVLVAPQLLHTTVFDPWHVLASFLFVPARHPLTGDFWPLLVPGWTLNLEMLFYVLFSVSIALSGGSLARRLVWLSGLFFAVLMVSNVLKSRVDIMNFYANPIILEFLAGTLLGILYLSGRMRTSGFWFAAIILGFLLLWKGYLVLGSIPYTGLAATMIVAGALFAPPIKVPFLQAVGDASYSLYLTHVITLAGVAAIWTRQSLVGGPWLFSLACVLGALAVATLCYRFVERPVTAALKKASLRSPLASRLPRAARTASAKSTSEAAE